MTGVQTCALPIYTIISGRVGNTIRFSEFYLTEDGKTSSPGIFIRNKQNSELDNQPIGTLIDEDINKDGTDDVAVVLTNDAGGSGTFYYLAIFTSGSSPVIENTSYLGDRIVVNDITFTNNQFQVKYLDRDSEADMASDPTIEITGIAEMDAENTGFIFSCTDTAGICL